MYSIVAPPRGEESDTAVCKRRTSILALRRLVACLGGMSEPLGDVLQDKGPSIAAGLLLGLISLVSGALFVLTTQSVFTDGFSGGDAKTLAISGLVAVAGLAATVTLLMERVQIREKGVLCRSILGTVKLPFADVRSISVTRVSSKSSLNADLRTGQQDLSTTLTLSDGLKRKVTLQNATFGADASLEQLARELTERVAAQMSDALEQTGKTSLVTGLALEGDALVGLIPYQFTVPQNNEMPARVLIKSSPLRLELDDEAVAVTIDNGWLYLHQGEQVVGVLSSSIPNVFPMLSVLKDHSSWHLPG